MSIRDGNVTLSLDDYDQLRKNVANAQKEAAKALERARQVELTDPDGTDRILKLVGLVQASLPVIQFAVGNLDPRTVKDWPARELIAFAQDLQTMAGAQPGHQELALELIAFGQECLSLERFRAQRDGTSAA